MKKLEKEMSLRCGVVNVLRIWSGGRQKSHRTVAKTDKTAALRPDQKMPRAEVVVALLVSSEMCPAASYPQGTYPALFSAPLQC